MGEKYEYNQSGAEAYKELGIEGTTYEMSFSEMKRMLGNIQGMNFLDFGCGSGRSARFLKTLGAKNVIGVDHNESMIKQAKATAVQGIDFRLIKEKIPLDDDSVDGVISSAVFLEIKNLADMEKTAREIARVLKPGGVFILVTVNPDAFGHDFVSFTRTGNPAELESGDMTECRMKGKKPFVIDDIFWTEDDYRQVLESAGFTIEDIVFPKAESGNWLDETNVAPDMVIKATK
ncbi:class I SAM-dependent methyltransferase [Patescibacteria group bacterium]|nr:class I SAM-dependent methyltransferase [Patescibacteria group bacterium]MBU1673983.1 class I SAM-dependent methyltransferase [Patescibacteria group bacterium]MBU1962943.1 class I SAM-dependent methyltransferase [Patescibacteria group bacterium]